MSPWDAVHRLIAWSMVAFGCSGVLPELADDPLPEET